jgi:hypothetical protein
VQLLDLPDGNRAIGTIQDAFDETALRVPRAIRKLWHAKKNLLPNPNSETRIRQLLQWGRAHVSAEIEHPVCSDRTPLPRLNGAAGKLNHKAVGAGDHLFLKSSSSKFASFNHTSVPAIANSQELGQLATTVSGLCPAFFVSIELELGYLIVDSRAMPPLAMP